MYILYTCIPYSLIHTTPYELILHSLWALGLSIPKVGKVFLFPGDLEGISPRRARNKSLPLVELNKSPAEYRDRSGLGRHRVKKADRPDSGTQPGITSPPKQAKIP